METFGIGMDEAYNMAVITRGYPVAYQALGQHLWESGRPKLTPSVLQRFDDTLDVKVYSSIWKSLNKTEKMYLSLMAKEDTKEILTSKILEKSGKSAGNFSPYRERLIEKGILEAQERGILVFALPRFEYFIRQRIHIEEMMEY